MFDAQGFEEFAEDCRHFADDLREVAEDLPKAVDDSVEHSSERLEEEMKAEIHNLDAYDSGTMYDSISSDMEESAKKGEVAKASVGPTVDYAPYVEYGTDPHTITPEGTTEGEVRERRERMRNHDGGPLPEDVAEAPALQFTVNGSQVTVDMVEHPGSDAKPFFRNSFKRHKQNKHLIKTLDKRTSMLFKGIRD